MRNPPFGGVSVAEEHASGGCLERVQRVRLVDFLGEEVGFVEDDGREDGVVGLVDCAAESVGLD